MIGFDSTLPMFPGARPPATSLKILWRCAGTFPFTEILARSFGRWLERWRNEGLAPVRRQWLAGAHPLGTALRTPDGEGLFDGLDADGALRLRLADGSLRFIHAGDVFLI